jgi:hypothetical protein
MKRSRKRSAGERGMHLQALVASTVAIPSARTTSPG